ncbi:MAG TPA: hypothetical protein VFC47_12170 [Caulobacteraceae bacterium]|nr:hypothetical protein [Caulobacteraceae bacterium]
MDDLEDRLDAIERLLAEVIADKFTPAELARRLDDELPAQQYALSPATAGLLPHFERIFDLAAQLHSARRAR